MDDLEEIGCCSLCSPEHPTSKEVKDAPAGPEGRKISRKINTIKTLFAKQLVERVVDPAEEQEECCQQGG